MIKGYVMSKPNKEHKITVMNDAYLFDGQGKCTHG